MNNFIIPPITSSTLVLTNQCCLRCKYCFESHFDEYMSYQTAKDIVDFVMNNYKSPIVKKNKIPGFCYFGGEPLMMYNEIIEPLTEYIRDTYGSVPFLSMTTNGILLDENKLRFLKKNNCSIMISLDGDKKSQDANRILKSGGSSFDILQKKIPIVLEVYPNCSFRITLTRETLPYLMDNILFIESIGAKNLKIEPNILEVWSEDDNAIFCEQIEFYTQYVIQKFNNGELPLIFKEFSNMFFDMMLIDKSNSIDAYRSCYGCAAYQHCGIGMRGSATIGPDGSIYACHRVEMTHDSPFYIGDIYNGVDEGRIKDLITSIENDYKKNPKMQDCDSCLRDRICDGGCMSSNYAANMNYAKIPKTYCYWNKGLLDAAVKVCKTLSDSRNENFRDFFQRSVKRGKI